MQKWDAPIGATNSALNQELELRKRLGDYKLVTEILAHSQDNITIDIKPQNPPEIETIFFPIPEIDTASEYLQKEYLEDEYCPFADFEKTRGIKALMQKEIGDF